MSVNVTATYTFTKFKGVKDLDKILKKERSDLTDEEIWDRILDQSYEEAYCPGCHTKLIIKSFTVEYQVNPLYVLHKGNYWHSSVSWNIRIVSPIINAEMECPGCGNIIKGLGTGLNLEGDSFYLETLSVISIDRGQWIR